MSVLSTYYMATSGRPKELLEGWREQFLKSYTDYMEWGRELGAKRIFRDYDGIPMGFSFPRDSEPEGWTKMDSSGFSRPKKNNHAARERIEALNLPQNVEEFVCQNFGLPSAITYEKNGEIHTKGLVPRGKLSVYEFLWYPNEDGTPGRVIMRAPDFLEAIESLGDVDWLPEGSLPDIPDGFIGLTQEELDAYRKDATIKREKYVSKCQDMITVLNVQKPEDLYNGVIEVLAANGYSVEVDVCLSDGRLTADCRYTDQNVTVHPPVSAAIQKLLTVLVEEDLESRAPGTHALILISPEQKPTVSYRDPEGAVENEFLQIERLNKSDFEEPGL
jgi:hypothetical protein